MLHSRTGPSGRWLEGDKREETFKQIYDRFSLTVAWLTTSAQFLWVGGGQTRGSDKCVFILGNLCLLQCQKKKPSLLKTDKTLNSDLIPDYGLSWPPHLISVWSN